MQSHVQIPAEALRVLACGHCVSPLRADGDGLRCSKCDRLYPIRDGIPVLAERDDHEFQEVPIDMAPFLADARQRGWEPAFEALLERLPAKHREFLVHYATDTRRAGWKFLMDLRPQGVAVDFGCGWGALTIGLSANFGTVLAFDLSPTRIAVTWHRTQNGNVVPIRGGDSPRLPLASNSVDAFALNGVLEYIGGDDPDHQPQRQLEFLQEVYRVLKPDGQLYVGIENRFGWSYWLGRSNPKFITLLPRRLAQWYHKRVKGEPYRICHHSYRGYQRLFNHAGFPRTDFYAAYPHYGEFTHQIPLDDNRLASRAFSPRSLKAKLLKRLLLPVGFLRHFTYCYAIVAWKNAGTPAFLQQLAGKIKEGSRLRMLYMNIAGSGKSVIYFGDAGDVVPRYVALLSLTGEAARQLSATARHLSELRARGVLPTAVERALPAVVAQGELNGQTFLAMRYMAGDLADKHFDDERFRAALLERAAEFITELGAATATHEIAGDTQLAEHFSSLIDDLRARHPEFLSADTRDRCVELARRCWSGKRLPLVFGHGDYGPQHFFVNYPSAEIAGVIDWGLSTPRDLPLDDLLILLVHFELHSGAPGQVEALRAALESTRSQSPQRAVVSRYCERLELPAGAFQVAAMMYLFQFYRAMKHHPPRKYVHVLKELEPTLKWILGCTDLP